jgi:hypothetical protein
MALTVNQGFEEFLGRLTPTPTEISVGASHRASVSAALESNFKIYSFFESGSFSHGTGVRGFSDIDAFVSLGMRKPGASYTALEWVRDVLKTRFPTTPVAINRPAVVVRFGTGLETWEVIPAFVKRIVASEFVYDIPGASTGSGWIESAPKLHLGYVNACNQIPSYGKAKALSRLIKAWKFFNNVPISSFYLEMRCAQHVAGETAYIHVWDVYEVLDSMYMQQLEPMWDPTGTTGWFHACSSDSNRAEALAKLLPAVAHASLARDADRASDPATAFYHLNKLFGGKFPAR